MLPAVPKLQSSFALATFRHNENNCLSNILSQIQIWRLFLSNFFQMLFVVQTSRGGRKTRWAQFDEPILVQIDNLQTKLFFLPQRP